MHLLRDRYLLTSVERTVSERNQLEQIAAIFQNLASRRINESETMVKAIHRTAAELSDSIKLDMTRIVDAIDGGIFGSFTSLLSQIDLNPLKRFKL